MIVQYFRATALVQKLGLEGELQKKMLRDKDGLIGSMQRLWKVSMVSLVLIFIVVLYYTEEVTV